MIKILVNKLIHFIKVLPSILRHLQLRSLHLKVIEERAFICKAEVFLNL